MYLAIGLTIHPISISFISNPPLLSSRLNVSSARVTWMPYKRLCPVGQQVVRGTTSLPKLRAGTGVWVLLSHQPCPFVSSQLDWVQLSVTEYCPLRLLSVPFHGPFPSHHPTLAALRFLTEQLQFLLVSFLFPLWSGPYAIVTVVSWPAGRILSLHPESFIFSLFRAVLDPASFPATFLPAPLTLNILQTSFLQMCLSFPSSTLHRLYLNASSSVAPQQKNKHKSETNLVAEKALFFMSQILTP